MEYQYTDVQLLTALYSHGKYLYASMQWKINLESRKTMPASGPVSGQVPGQASAISEIDLPKLDLDRPAAEQIFVGLRDAILSMELAPGCVLSESEIGQRFGASRTPVRSALGQLRDLGLVVTRPSRGNYVAKLSEQKIRAAQFIRESLELGIVRRLCEMGLSDEDREGLELTLKRQKLAIQNAQEEDFHMHDEAFHNSLALATGMKTVQTVYMREKADLDRLRHLGMDNESHKNQLWAEHKAILDAIIAGDATAAEAAMQTHVRCMLGKLSGLMAANKDFFG